MKTYKGRYRIKNISKYKGNPDKCTYRSLWERQAFRYLDEHSNVVKWSSEEVVIPYRCKTDGKLHRYFTDLYIEMSDGNKFIIEIKPKAQTKEPKKRSRKTKKYINEVMTYVKNQSKWEAAEEYCADRGWKFAVWTEETLKGLGIKILT